ncbi:MAG TPA: type I restriction enzyme HsdR N-terminal domain-containing protein [Chitinophagales bacterium]|nr:type I restriction enzyme HsdR N-terminal domain-containing protein [Chitinophagales bacterium]
MQNTAFRLKKEKDKTFIFDIVRKKWIVFTPEEQVRQYCIRYLTDILLVPLSFISVEKSLTINGLKKRYDIVVYNKNLKPVLLVECKADTEALDEKVCKQIAIYNLQLNVPYLWLSNGKKNYYFNLEENKILQIPALPFYDEM